MGFENQHQGSVILQGVKISEENFKETRMHLNQQKHKMTLKSEVTSGQSTETSSSQHRTSSSSSRTDEKNHFQSSLKYIDDQDNSHKSGCVARKTYQRLQEC